MIKKVIEMDRILLSEIEEYARLCYKDAYGMNQRMIQNQMKSFVVNYGKKKHKRTFDRDLAIRGLANNLVPNLLKGYFTGTPPRTTQGEKMLMGAKVLPIIMPDINNAKRKFDAGYYYVGGEGWKKKKR